MSKVAITRCPDYDSQRVLDAVRRAVDLVGGIGSYVKPGMKVLLKPNLLSARTPEEAVDTHPEVVRAAVRLVREAGGAPVIGDSPGGYGKNIDEVLERSGMRAMADAEGAEIVRFTSSRYVGGIPVARQYFDSDLVVSIPKLKTHCITVMTAAIKNMFGAVPGLFKAECHSKAPKEEEFARTIANVYSVARPHLNILDAIVAMEGDGPSSGTPRKMELVMASDDAVSIDACAAKIIGLEPMDILVTREAAKAGLGEADLKKIEIAGDDPNGFLAADFRMPQTTALKYIPKGVAETVARFIRFKPHIDNALCRRCNLCKTACPVQCIEIGEKRCDIDYAKCVRCLCCHEVCPYRAIDIRGNLLTKLVWG
jgi:uncharacterized protein (DUF362 family)/NAD-dependent dihydropyrimidine dehydrogenase PreA subunit